MYKSKFNGGFKAKEPQEVWLGVSLDNPNLKDEKLNSFFKEIHKHRTKISNLKIAVGDRMLAFYLGDAAAKKIAKEWREKAQQYLQKYRFKYDLISWYELEKTPEYKKRLQQVRADYDNNEDFKRIVDDIAKVMAKRKCASEETTREYLLHDCTGFLCFKNKVAYPSSQLNHAIKWQIENKQTGLEYCGYSITMKHNTNDLLQEMLNKQDLLLNTINALNKRIEQLEERLSDDEEEQYKRGNSFFLKVNS